MKNNKGISLIVLVITIIIMIILGTAVVVTLSNSGIISKANEAVKVSNLSQIQHAAALAWSDAYLAGERGDKLVQTVKDKLFDIDDKYDEKYDVEITDAGVNIALKDEGWEIIYSGNELTEEGVLIISDKAVFDPLQKYRITIEANGNRYVLTPPKLIAIEGTAYFLGAIVNGKPTYFNSLEEIMSAITTFPIGTIAVVGCDEQENGETFSTIMLEVMKDEEDETTQTECKIVKVERRDAGIRELYSGTVAKDQTIVLENVEFTTKFVVQYKGQECQVGYFGDAYIVVANTPNSTVIGVIMPNEQNEYIFGALVDLEDLAIYDYGKNPDIVKEGEYVAIYSDNQWVLVNSPINAERLHIVPETVGGKVITAVSVGSMADGVIYYSRELEVQLDGLQEATKNFKVSPGVSPAKLFDAMIENYSYWITVDLTELDDVTIPDELLPSLKYSGYRTLYVTQAVKDRYPDYDSIKVKTN